MIGGALNRLRTEQLKVVHVGEGVELSYEELAAIVNALSRAHAESKIPKRYESALTKMLPVLARGGARMIAI